MSPNRDKRQIVILGGGVSSLTTALMLTEREGWQDDYDVTVYQLGWRLGGKGASGRNMDPVYSKRIEEHGIHIFFGFYDNAFRVMETCYREMDRPRGAPLATVDEAFKGHGTGVLESFVDRRWHHQVFVAPPNQEKPGSGGVLLHPTQYLVEFLELIDRLLGSAATAGLERQIEARPRGVHPLLDRLEESLRDELRPDAGRHRRLLQALALLARRCREEPERLESELLALRGRLAGWCARLLRRLPRFVGRPLGWLAKRLTRLLDHLERDAWEALLWLAAEVLGGFLDLLWPLVKGRIDRDPAIHELWTGLNFAYGNLRGMLADDLIHRGVESINDQNYADWLEEHAKKDGGRTAGSFLVRWVYDAVFAYPRGDMRKPDLEAGSAFLSNFRVFLTYKGNLYYKMQAGMGDVVFAPLYLVLKKRGVRFELFHQVLDLGLSADGRRIEKVRLRRQAQPREHGGYDPLVDVKGLPCWPSTPLYDRLRRGDEIRRLVEEGVDLESFDAPWPGAEELDLELGPEDEVVLGISRAALPCICGALIDRSARWRRMIESVQTVRTQAFQLWLKPTLSKLGWRASEEPPMLTAYDLALSSEPRQPVNSWVDMTQTKPAEDWPPQPGRHPEEISYFCCPMADDDAETDPCNPDPLLDRVRATALDFLDRHMHHLLPESADPPSEPHPSFHYDLLVDNRSEPGQGPARFDSQYWVSIHNPSDRYVLSVTGSSRARLPAHDGEFANLYLVGDWVRNPLNVGCVEACVMSAMAASNALIGYPKLDEIVGWDFLQSPRR